MRNSLLAAATVAASLSTSTFPATASSDSGIAYRCTKVDGRYVWRNGSICFPHESAEMRVRRERAAVGR